MRRLATLVIVIAAAALTAAGQLTITTTSVPNATIGQLYGVGGAGVPLHITGATGVIQWSFAEGGNPPPNFTIQAAPVGQPNQDGTFCYGSCSGAVVQSQLTPPGVYSFTIEAFDTSSQRFADQPITMVVEFPLQIVTTSLPNAIANQAYSTQLAGFGGTGQFVWSLQSGVLPPGIGLDAFKGTLAGTAPGINGVYPFTIQLLDQVTQETVTQALSITVINGVAILTTSLPNATVNQVYQFQLQGTGPNLVWSVPQGSQLPPGFTMTSGGLIIGVGSAVGPLNFPIQLANAQAPSAAAFRLLTLLVTLGELSITELTLPGATQNVPYTTTLTPNGGIPPYTWSLGVSSLKGLSIGSNSGIISGTLTTPGSFPIQVTLRDSGGAAITQIYTLNVGNAVSITTTSLPNGPPNVGYSATLTGSGGSIPYRWSVLTGSLPTGLTLHSDTGVIDGIPTAQGAFRFTIQVTDFVGGVATKAFTVTIGPFLTITNTTLPGGALTQQYSQTLTAINGTPPLIWSMAAGALPPGLQLNGASGVISGIPTSLGSSTFDILVTDGTQSTARRTFTITISNALVITSGDFAGNVLTALTQTLTATGGTPPYTWSISAGTLPGGLQLNSATGVISGAPSPQGSSQVTFTATDALGLTGSKTINITIIAPPTPAVSIGLGSTTQPAVSLTTAAAYPLEITGFLTLTFASSPGGTDGGEARFSDGSRKLFYVVRANTTQGLFTTVSNGTPAIITGTVAGTITVTTSMSAGGLDITPSPAPTKTIVIAPAVPVISQVVLQQVTGGLNVVVSGYSNTREVSSGSFTFTVSSGNTLSQATITVQLASAYAAWFGNSSSSATGGQFKLTVPFSVTQGAATAVTKVSVTLTNGQGTSAASSSP